MTAYTIPEPVSSPYLTLGDDVYAKSLTPWVPDTWITGMVLGEPVVGQLTWNLEAGVNGLDTVKAYLVFANQAFRSFTANATTNVFTSAAHELIIGTRVYFRGTDLPAGLVVGQAYWVTDITTDTFTLRDNVDLTGSAVDITDAGTGTIQFVATSYRSSSDQQIGTIPAREVVPAGEGEATAALVAAMLADTTIAASFANAATAAKRSSVVAS